MRRWPWGRKGTGAKVVDTRNIPPKEHREHRGPVHTGQDLEVLCLVLVLCFEEFRMAMEVG